MHERLKRMLLRLLRVPPEPHPPSGSPGSIRTFRAARNYYRYKLLRWGLKQLGALAGIFVLTALHVGYGMSGRLPWEAIPRSASAGKAVEEIRKDGRAASFEKILRWALEADVLLLFELVGFGVLVLQAPVSYAMVRLDYEMRWYIVTDRSLRIREGIATVREMTMTFANVQNLTIEQGPIQRLLGISDLRVRTAGGGSDEKDEEHGGKQKESMHVGYLRGVDNAPEIRETILARLRRVKGAGLGDPEDEAGDAPLTAGDPVAAARELLCEARALRKAVSGEV